MVSNMDPVAIVIAVVSLVVSIVVGFHNSRTASASVEAARRSAAAAESSQALTATQLETTVSANQAAVQPYVWADIRVREDGTLLVLVVGNSGPTVATNVTIKFDPSLRTSVPNYNDKKNADSAEQVLAQGLSSLPPGRVHQWTLGRGSDFFEDGREGPAFDITITADGPHGPIPKLRYTLNIDEMKYTNAVGEGLGLVKNAIQQLTGETKRIAQAIDRATEN